jgi:hypothetical protein
MTEPLNWLKLGTRSRTPTTPVAANSREYKVVRDYEPGDSRQPGLSRLSSHATPLDGDAESLSVDDEDSSLLIRQQDQVWYNPVSSIQYPARRVT